MITRKEVMKTKKKKVYCLDAWIKVEAKNIEEAMEKTKHLRFTTRELEPGIELEIGKEYVEEP